MAKTLIEVYNALKEQDLISIPFEQFQARYTSDANYRKGVDADVYGENQAPATKNTYGGSPFMPTVEEPAVKKKDAMASSLETGSSAYASLPPIQPIKAQTETTLVQKPLAPLQKKVEDARVPVIERNIAKFSESQKNMGMPGAKPPAYEKIEPIKIPAAIDEQLSIINKKLVSNEEESVVPELKYRFEPLGFKFEETGALGDAMLVTSPTGSKIEISLDNFRNSNNRKESEKLNNFLKYNIGGIPNLQKLESEYVGEKRKYLTQKEVDDNIKSMNKAENDFLISSKSFIEKSNQLNAEYELINNTPENQRNTLEFAKRVEEYNKKLAELKPEADAFTKQYEGLQSRSKALSRTVGKYVEMKAQQGEFSSYLNNKVVSAFEGFTRTGNYWGNYMASFMNDDPTRNAAGIFEIAHLNGMKTPFDGKSFNPKSEEDVKKFTEWSKSIKDFDKWQDQLDDKYFKEGAYGKVSNVTGLREGGTMTDIKKFFDNFRSENSSIEYQQLKDSEFWAGAVGGLLQSIPAMIGTPTQRFGLMTMQQFIALDDQMSQDPDFNNMPENQKLAINIPLAIVSGALEYYGFRNAIQSRGLLNSFAMRAIRQSGRNITAKTFRELVERDVKGYVQKFGLTLAGAALAEGETGAAQQGAEIGAKMLFNELKEKDLFQTPNSITDGVFEITKAGAQEAIGGFLMGIPAAVSVAVNNKTGYQGMSDDMFNAFRVAANDVNMQSAFVTNLMNKVNTGEITRADAKKIIDDYRSSTGLFNQLPDNITDINQQKEAMNLLREKRDLEKQIEGKDKSLSQKQRTRIDEIDKELTKISENAIQEQTTGQVPIQPTTGVGSQVEEGISEPKPILTTEQIDEKVKKELPEGITISSAIDEEGEPDYEAEDAVRQIAKKRNLGITRDRELSYVARDNEGNVIGGAFTSYDGDKYTFDVVVDEAYDGQGIGSNLLDAVEKMPSYIEEQNPNAKVEVDVVNPTMQKMLENRGFQVTQQIGEGRVLMEPTEAKPVQPQVAEEVKVQPVSGIDVNQLTELESRVTDDLQKRVVGQVRNAVRSVRQMLPNLEFVVHEDENSYDEAMDKYNGKKSTAGNFAYGVDANGNKTMRVDINLKKANSRTVTHELGHAVLYHAFGDSPTVFKAFAKRLSPLVDTADVEIRKANGQKMKLSQYLNDFANQEGYAEDVKPEEFLVEMSAALSSAGGKISTSTWIKIGDLVNKVVSKLTNGKVQVFENSRDTKATIEFFNDMATRMRLGVDLTEATNKIANINALKENLSAPIGNPVTLSKSSIGTPIEFKDEKYDLSFVSEKHKIDINQLIKDILANKQKVWFWMADQLGRGYYFDETIGKEHYLDAGPSFALDPDNIKQKYLWASGLAKKTLDDNIKNSDYIFFISGSPEKAKLFNKSVVELIGKRIESNSSFDEFKKAINKFPKETNELIAMRDVLNRANSFEQLKDDTKRKDFLLAIDAVKNKKTAPPGSLKELLGNFGAFIDLNELRDGFYRENEFNQNDIMLVGKPTGLGDKTVHSTYLTTILGEVVGVPDKKINAWDIMPKSLKDQYGDALSVSQKTKIIAAETGIIRGGTKKGFTKSKSQNIATAFSGAGTMEAALKDPTSVMAVEFNPNYIKAYNEAFGTNYNPRDVNKIDPQEVIDAKPDIFHASPVCKSFSKAKNKATVLETDMNSAKAVAKVITEAKPPVVTIENVTQYKGTVPYNVIINALEKAGYTYDANFYNAADYGGVQSRDRLIIRAVREGELPPMPEKKQAKDWFKAIESMIDDAPDTKFTSKTKGQDNWEVTRINDMIKKGKLDPKKPIITMGGSAYKGVAAAANPGGPAPTLLSSTGSVPRIIMPDGRVKRVTPEMMRVLMDLPDTYKVPSDWATAKEVLGNGISGVITKAVIQPMAEAGEKINKGMKSKSQITEEKSKMIADVNKRANDQFGSDLLPSSDNDKVKILLNSEVERMKDETCKSNQCESNVYKLVKSNPNKYYPAKGFFINMYNGWVAHWLLYDRENKKYLEITPDQDGTPSDYTKGYVMVLDKTINDDIVKSEGIWDVDFFRMNQYSNDFLKLINPTTKSKSQLDAKQQNQVEALKKEAKRIFDTGTANGDKKSIIRQAIENFIKSSATYNSLPQIEHLNIMSDVLASVGMKLKGSPSYNKLFGFLGQVRESKNEMNGLLNQLKILERSSKDVQNNIKSVMDGIKKAVAKMNKDGMLTSTQMASIINKMATMNPLDKKSVANFTQYLTEQFKKAEEQKIKENMRSLKDQIKLLNRGGNDIKKIMAEAKKTIINALSSQRTTGVITAAKAAAIVKRFAKVNLLNDASIDRFINYVSNILQKADYINKISNVRSLKQTLRKLASNTDKNPELRDFAKKMLRIDESDLDATGVWDIDQYTKYLEELIESLRGSKLTSPTPNQIRQGTAPNKYDVLLAGTTRIASLEPEVDMILDKQEAMAKQDLALELQQMTGQNTSGMTMKELRKAINDQTKMPPKDEQDAKNTIKDAVAKVKDIINEMFRIGIDPVTGNSLTFTEFEKQTVQDFMSIDLDKLSLKVQLQVFDMLTQYVANRSIANMGNTYEEYMGSIVKPMEVLNKGVEAVKVKKYFMGITGRFLTDQLASLPAVFERIFVGSKRGEYVRRAMGLSDVMVGKTKAQKYVNNIANAYIAMFFKTKPNGQEFNTSFNAVERGMSAFMGRSVFGNTDKVKDEFNRRKRLVEESIDALENGTKEEQQKAKVYRDVYDKVLKNANDYNDVKSNVDYRNQAAVDFWVNEWSKVYDRMSDVAKSIYNQNLGKDIFYTPDVYSRMEDDDSKSIQVVDQNGTIIDIPVQDMENSDMSFLYNTGLYKQQTGQLMQAIRPETLPTNPKGKAARYINLSFDMNNMNAMFNAMVDINTAASIRRADSFMASNEFEKIVPDKDDRKLLKDRVSFYFNNIRGVVPYSKNTDVDKFIRAINNMSTIGASMALAGVTSPFKQTIPVIFNTIVNANGRFDFGSYFNKDAMQFLRDSGYGIANRGADALVEIESLNKMLEKGEQGVLSKGLDGLANINKKLLDALLVQFDRRVAVMSWMTYYEQSLRDQGINTKNLDYSTHKLNKAAADYAEDMVNRQQNINDHDLAGRIFQTKGNPTKAFIIKAVMPFASFIVNQKVRMGNDLRTLQHYNMSTREDKIIAMKSLAAMGIEMLTFKALTTLFGTIISEAIASFRGGVGDDDEDKIKKKAKRQEIIAKGQVTSAINDLFSPAPIFDPAVQWTAYQLINKMQMLADIKEEDRKNIFEMTLTDFIKQAGMYGIAAERAKNLWDLGRLAYDGEFIDINTKQKKWISKSDQEIAKMFGIPLAIGTTLGVLPVEVNTALKDFKRNAQKEGSTTVGGETLVDKINKVIEKRTAQEKSAQSDESRRERLNALQVIMEKVDNPAQIDIINKMIQMDTMNPEEKKEYIESLKGVERDKYYEKQQLLSGYDNPSDMKKYNRALYEENFGKKSPYYQKNLDESYVEYLLSEELNLEEEKAYEFTPKKPRKKRNW